MKHSLRWMRSIVTGGRVFFFYACYQRRRVMANVGRDITYSWAEFMKFNEHRYSRRTVV